MLIGDSAYPPATYPTEIDGNPVVGWCVYIGGNTPHVWTDAEIAHLRAQPWCRYILPVFVRSHPQDAQEAERDAAAAIAWSTAHGQPRGTLVMWDYETAVDSVYELTVDQALRDGDGDLEVLYGSKATVMKNAAPSGGYDVADWTGVDHAPASTGVQFASVAAYDMNDFRTGAPLWDLRPAPKPPVPPIPAAAAAILEESSMQIEPTSIHKGEYAMVVPAGAVTAAFVADGYDAPGACLRVVLWTSKGEPKVIDKLVVGGRSPHHVVGIELDGAVGVTVRRLDAEDYPVAVGFRA